jgi:tRNA pseudouridine55 synthase
MKQGFLIIDKAKGWTSHDVVAKTRGILQERKIGHLGTLDPLATGVLVLAVGRDATKQVQELMGADKEYFVEMEMGKVSDTYDLEGEVRETGADLSSLDLNKIIVQLEDFWGKSSQMPPAFSAKKINGQPAYKLARAGKPVVLAPKEVEMEGWDVHWEAPFLRLQMRVSSGTYIRSFVHDLGEKLGCGAVMTALRRTRVGRFKLEDAVTIEALAENPLEVQFH